MGGRGEYSAGGRGVSDTRLSGSGSFMVVGSEETRPDIIRMSEMAGVSEIIGTGDMPTAILGAQLIQLQNLERQFGAAGFSGIDVIACPPEGIGGAIAAVAYNGQGKQTLGFNYEYYQSVSGINALQREMQQSGWKMPTDKSPTSLARYTVTHEYGHVMHNSLYNKAVSSGYKGSRKQFVASEWGKIHKMAVEKYGATKSDMSVYGGKNPRESFAESFANSQLGSPNAYGLAMRDYLAENPL